MNLHTAAFEMAAGISSQLPQSTMPEVAFSGRSNVGKSSLINRLVNRKALARTSATPGKTATINFYKLDTVRMVDLPGYGYAKVSDNERRRGLNSLKAILTMTAICGWWFNCGISATTPARMIIKCWSIWWSAAFLLSSF